MRADGPQFRQFARAISRSPSENGGWVGPLAFPERTLAYPTLTIAPAVQPKFGLTPRGQAPMAPIDGRAADPPRVPSLTH